MLAGPQFTTTAPFRSRTLQRSLPHDGAAAQHLCLLCVWSHIACKMGVNINPVYMKQPHSPSQHLGTSTDSPPPQTPNTLPAQTWQQLGGHHTKTKAVPTAPNTEGCRTHTRPCTGTYARHMRQPATCSAATQLPPGQEASQPAKTDASTVTTSGTGVMTTSPNLAAAWCTGGPETRGMPHRCTKLRHTCGLQSLHKHRDAASVV